MYNCNYIYYIIQSLFYVSTISKILRFCNVYFLGRINESLSVMIISTRLIL